MARPLEQTTLRLDDPDRFAVFYETALPRVYAYFHNRCGGDRGVAEDLTQEAFMAAVREIRKGKKLEDPSAWILGIARHKLVDHYRATERERRRIDAVASAATHEDFVEWSGRADEQDRAVEALGAVAGSQRAALVLRYLDGLSVPEVGAALGKSVHATESLLVRGKQSFKRAFEEVGDA